MSIKWQHLICIFFVLIIFAITSCKSDANLIEFQIGNNLVQADLGISVCDTFSIQLSTVQFDSISTSDTDSLLIGRIMDERMGKLLSRCYFSVSNPSISIQKEDVYDSISLVVKLNGYYYGDTTKMVNWNVYRLSEKLKASDDGKLYNNSSFERFEQPIGNLSFKPYPSRKQTINIPLDNALGKTLFDMAIDNDERILSADNFYNYFKGITIVPSDENMNTLMGVSVSDTSIVMRVYAHRVSEERKEINLDFSIVNTTLPFSQVTYNRTNTSLAALNSQKLSLSSALTQNESYIQGGSGVMTRVDIPGLAKVLELENVVIMKAELILYPVINTYETTQLPRKMNFFKCDRLNQMQYGYVEATTKAYIYGTLSISNDLYNENTFYSLDITEYIKDELSDSYYEPGKSGILLYYSDPGFLVTASRLVLGNSHHKNQKAKLKLYFLHYN